jgi:hypothetical protein
MGTSSHRSEADQYLALYPHLHRWMNVCAGCGARGHRPELPENIYPHFNVAAENLRRYFRPLAVDERGFCEQCSAAMAAAWDWPSGRW